MERKVAQTELDLQEYSALVAAAKKNKLTIKEALRKAVLQWVQENSGINSNDPIFRIKGVGGLGKRNRERVKGSRQDLLRMIPGHETFHRYGHVTARESGTTPAPSNHSTTSYCQ